MVFNAVQIILSIKYYGIYKDKVFPGGQIKLFFCQYLANPNCILATIFQLKQRR